MTSLLSLPTEILHAILAYYSSNDSCDNDTDDSHDTDTDESINTLVAANLLSVNRRLHEIAERLVYANPTPIGYKSTAAFISTLRGRRALADTVQTLRITCQSTPTRPSIGPHTPEVRKLWRELGRSKLPKMKNCHRFVLDPTVYCLAGCKKYGHNGASALMFADILLHWAHACPNLESIDMWPFLSGYMIAEDEGRQERELERVIAERSRIPRSLTKLTARMTITVKMDDKYDFDGVIWKMCAKLLDTPIISTQEHDGHGHEMIGIQALSPRLRKLSYDGTYINLSMTMCKWYHSGFLDNVNGEFDGGLELLEELRWPIGWVRFAETPIYEQLRMFDATVGPFPSFGMLPERGSS